MIRTGDLNTRTRICEWSDSFEVGVLIVLTRTTGKRNASTQDPGLRDTVHLTILTSFPIPLCDWQRRAQEKGFEEDRESEGRCEGRRRNGAVERMRIEET